MSQRPTAGMAVTPGEPDAKQTNWRLIGIIVLAVLGLLACLACVLPPIAMSLAGPAAIMESTLNPMCAIEYPDLDSGTCARWANDMANNHFEEYVECSNANNEDPDGIFRCLEAQGLAPDQ